jgi:hypothetical protein
MRLKAAVRCWTCKGHLTRIEHLNFQHRAGGGSGRGAGAALPPPDEEYQRYSNVIAMALQPRNPVSPIAVETGNGAAADKAERVGGASRAGRRRLRVARVGNLRDRAPDARAYAQSPSSPRFSLSGAKMVPGTRAAGSGGRRAWSG